MTSSSPANGSPQGPLEGRSAPLLFVGLVLLVNSLAVAYGFYQLAAVRQDLRWLTLVTVPTNAARSPAPATATPPSPAKLKAELYTDFGCPFCRASAIAIDSARRHFGDQVEWVFHPVPRSPRADPLSFEAALAATCMGQTEQVWKLFAAVHDTTWTRAEFERARRTSGVSGESLRSCMSADSTERVVWAGLFAAGRAGVKGTPTIVVANRSIEGQITYGALVTMIDYRLRNPGFTMRGGERIPDGQQRPASR